MVSYVGSADIHFLWALEAQNKMEKMENRGYF